MRASYRLLLVSLSASIAACSVNVKDDRLESFATGLPEGEVSAISSGYDNQALTLNDAGLSDADHDGVIDYRDQCNENFENALVDNSGCLQKLSEVKTTDLTIQFDSSSATVKPEYFEEIGALAILHQQNPDHKILIEGHSDSSGERAANIDLSKARADAVAMTLIDKYSVPKEDILTSGFGPDEPVADNATAEGRKKNRRMVAHVVYVDRITQHQWNIWSVELGSKQTEVKQFYTLEGIE